MLKNTFKTIFILFSITCTSQVDNRQSLNLSVGYGNHGSGDIYGYQYSVQYIKDFSNRWSWSIELGGSLHDSPDDALSYVDVNGNTFDATLHNVISGLQAGFGAKFNIIKAVNHRFGIEVIPFLRYQATSISDVIITIFDPDLPFPVRNLIRLEPARTYSFGSSFRLNYQYHVGSNYLIGIGGAFQTDTNGDTILGALLSFGKRF